MSEDLKLVLRTIKESTKKVEELTKSYEYSVLLESIQNPDLEIVEAYFEENK